MSTKPILVICHYCKSKIPYLTIEGTDVTFKCFCRRAETKMHIRDFLPKSTELISNGLCLEHKAKGEQYCTDCSSWLCLACLKNHIRLPHYLMDYELGMTCSQHFQKFTHHCHLCLMNLCDECTINHTHRNITIIPIIKAEEIYKKTMLGIENQLAYNKQMLDEFGKRIGGRKEDNLIKMNTDLQKAYEVNILFNIQLKELYQRIYVTATYVKTNPYYQISYMLSVLKPNEKRIVTENRSIEEIFEDLKQHYFYNFIITSKQDEIIQYKSTFFKNIESLGQLSKTELFACCVSSLLIIDLTTFSMREVYKDKDLSYQCAIKLSNGKIAVLSTSGIIQVFDPANWKIKHSLKNVSNNATYYNYFGILLELTNGLLVSTGEDIKIWEITKGVCKYTLNKHTDKVLDVVQLNNTTLVSASMDQTIKVWNFAKGTCTSTLTGHTDSVSCLIKLSNGLLASGSKDNTVKLWNVTKGTCKATINETASVHSLYQLKNGLLVVGTTSPKTNLWNADTMQVNTALTSDLITKDYDYKNEFRNFYIELDNDKLVAGGMIIRIYDLK